PWDQVFVNGAQGNDAVRVPLAQPTQVYVGGDGGNDTATLVGTANDDKIDIIADAANGAMVVRDDGARVVARTEAFVADAGAGNDTIFAGNYPGTTTRLTLNGNVGNDNLIGSRRADTLVGGPGDDRASGGLGTDNIVLGLGNDYATWSSGED